MTDASPRSMTRASPATWRSLMFVPATGEKFVAKAHTRGADVVILDLEDSIPPGEKAAARAALPAAAASVGQAGAEVAYASIARWKARCPTSRRR